MPTLTGWDIALVAAVTTQATVMAYLYQPRWKAFVFMLPIPFTFASLAVARPIDSSNPAGLLLLLAFVLAVRFLHVSLRVPIIVSIAVCAAGYCVLGGLLRPAMPAGSVGFWAMLAAVAAVAVAAYALMPPRDEQGHRTSLPVWIKLPVMAGVILSLIAIKSILAGFLTMFPMMATVTCYEARKSLWTVCRQVPLIMLMFVPMIATVYLLQDRLGFHKALAASWIVYLACLVPYWRFAGPGKVGP